RAICNRAFYSLFDKCLDISTVVFCCDFDGLLSSKIVLYGRKRSGRDEDFEILGAFMHKIAEYLNKTRASTLI
ncbi:MAG: hypothetical protein Q9183_007526, partial [Haloplaca sp. 2 TL-2023]